MRHNQVRQAAHGVRRHAELGKSVLQRADAGEVLEHPRADVSEHDVIAGGIPLPVLPQCRRTVPDPVSPAGIFLLHQNPAGELRISVVGKHAGHVFGAENPEVRPAARGGDF